MTESATSPTALVHSLRDATNARDIEALVGCFSPDYRNETPVHPARGFVGREQVRRNWTQIFASISDLSTEITASAESGPTVWSEWEHRGTRPDGTAHLMRGVIVFEVADRLITSARFFLEPVEAAGTGVDAAVRNQVRAGRAS